MATIQVKTTIRAPVERVWAHLEDVGSHVEWMAEAVSIRFLSPQRQGVGTTFDCDTRLGPLRTVDRMTITEWVPPGVMGVSHTGAVTGVGRFTLTSLAAGRSLLVWTEELTFPWQLGGPPGAAMGALALRLVWRRNLARLRRLVEAGA